jgi:hypothetical protein
MHSIEKVNTEPVFVQYLLVFPMFKNTLWAKISKNSIFETFLGFLTKDPNIINLFNYSTKML